MLRIGYKQSQGDHTLFVKHSSNGKITILLVYVDDIIIAGDDVEEKRRFQDQLTQEFEIKELGRLKYFLGIEVAYSKQGIFLSQKYILDLHKDTGMIFCEASSTHIDLNHRTCANRESSTVDKGRYQRLVGRLIYLSHTRPNIAYVVSIVSQFMHEPTEEHLQAVLRILQYLKATPGKGILYKKGEELIVEAYSYVDYAGSVVNRSTTGYYTFIAGNLVTWRSKKLSVVARSSVEAEFRAM